MFSIDSDLLVYVDVDDTLLSFDYDSSKPYINVTCDGVTEKYNPIYSNVEYIKMHRSRGHRVVVWSHGGIKWAKAVVKALKLEKYVDATLAKPRWIIDDLEASEWMPKASFRK